MQTISLKDADGKDPLPICQRNRAWLTERYKDPEIITLRYFSDEVPVANNVKHDEGKVVKHIRECPKCREWFHFITPTNILQRQHRLSKYCCAGMFCAVEESTSRSTPCFSFTMFRGEDPCWMIEGISAFASYCPWCGKKLPNGPFVSE
jgi:hypothetical protein